LKFESGSRALTLSSRHCEERGDKAIQLPGLLRQNLDCIASLAMTQRNHAINATNPFTRDDGIDNLDSTTEVARVMARKS
jgi:hypothetical protein